MNICVVDEGSPECNHKWGRIEFTLDCLPPIHHRECEVCGRVEAYSDERESVVIKEDI